MSTLRESEGGSDMVKRQLLWIAALSITMSALTLLAPSEAHACSCAPPRPVKQVVREHLAIDDSVFTGKVLAHTEQSADASGNPTRMSFLFEVTAVWKGTVQSRVIAHMTRFSMCEFPFQVGESYLV